MAEHETYRDIVKVAGGVHGGFDVKCIDPYLMTETNSIQEFVDELVANGHLTGQDAAAKAIASVIYNAARTKAAPDQNKALQAENRELKVRQTELGKLIAKLREEGVDTTALEAQL